MGIFMKWFSDLSKGMFDLDAYGGFGGEDEDSSKTSNFSLSEGMFDIDAYGGFGEEDNESSKSLNAAYNEVSTNKQVNRDLDSDIQDYNDDLSDTTEDLYLSRRSNSLDSLDLEDDISTKQTEYKNVNSINNPNESYPKIELKGKALFRELLKDVSLSISDSSGRGELEQKKFADIIEQRFKKTITSAVTGVSSDSLIMRDLINLGEKVNLNPRVSGELDDIINSALLSSVEKWDNVKQSLREKDGSLEGVTESIAFLEECEKRRVDSRTQDMMSKQASSLEKDDESELSTRIKLAAKKLSEEILQEKTPGFLWNYENSLKKAEKERSVFNVVGKVYDTIGSMCHSVAKYFGASKTAAELFEEAASYAQKLHNNLREDQIDIKNTNALEGESSNVNYYDMKKRGLDNSSKEEIQKKVSKHNSKVSDQMLSKLKEQFGEDVASRVISRIGNVGRAQSKANFINPERDDAQVSLDNFYEFLNDIHSVPNGKEHIEKLREAGVFSAMAKIEEALLVQDVEIEGKTYKGKISVDKIPEAMKKLEKAINQVGTWDEKQAFKSFKGEVKKIAPKETWANRALSAVGASKSRSF